MPGVPAPPMAKQRLSKRLESLTKRLGITGLVWLIGTTCRLRLINWHILEQFRDEQQAYAMGVWHNTLLYFIHLLGPYHYPTLISRSRDGDDINWVASRFGIVGVRGSPSAGATGAIREALRLVSGGQPVIFTVDGPRGPRYEVKPGIVAVARRKGLPIVPLGYSAPRRWVFNSWDRMMLPKPFSTVTAMVGEPIWPDPEGDEESDRLRVEEAMRELTRRVERLTGAEGTYPDPVLWGEAPEGD